MTYFYDGGKENAGLFGGDCAAAIAQCGRTVLRFDIKEKTVRPLYGGTHKFGCLLANGSPAAALETGFVAPESAKAYEGFYREITAGCPMGSVEAKLRRGDGELRWYHADFTSVKGPDGAPEHAVISVYDNTAQLERELAYEQWQKAVSSMMAESYFYLELNLTTERVERAEGLSNIGIDEETAKDPKKLEKHFLQKLVSGRDKKRVREFLDRGRLIGLFAAGIKEDSLEYRAALGSRAPWFRLSVQMARYPHRDDIKAFIVFENIDGMHGELERLARAASTDMMTGLLNRSAAEKKIKSAIRVASDGELIIMFIVDLDNFKLVNDLLGHQAGDKTLTEAAAVIRDVFRASDVVGRLGGDEFVVLISQNATPQIARRKAAALCEALQFAVEGNSGVLISASVGVCAMKKEDASFEEMYKRADAALYETKKAGKSGYRVHEGGGDVPAKQQAPLTGTVQLQALLQYMDAGVLLLELGAAARMIYASPGWCSAMGSAAGAYRLPRPLEDMRIHPDDAEGFERALRRGAEKEDVADFIFRNAPTGGKWYWRHARAVRIPYAGEHPVMLCVVTDITELKRTENRLRETSYRLAMRNMELKELLARTGQKTAGESADT